jgi:TPR repeat protein
MGKKIVCSLALAASLSGFGGGCASTTTKPPGAQPTLMDKLGTGIKNGSASVVAVFTPKRQAPDSGPPSNGKAGPAVFVAMAEVNERSDNLDEAEVQYKKALDIDSNHLGALLGYARLEDRRHNFEAAVKIYQRALKKHSRDAAVHNDLGLCYHHHDMLPEAAKSLQRAVELSGDHKLYRNNLAAVFVDQRKTNEALAQLIIAHGEAVGHYNLAYLLVKKQDNSAALAHFRTAAEMDPALAAAQQWIAKLSSPDGKTDSQAAQVAIVEIAQRPSAPSEQRTSAKFAVDSAASEPNAGSQVVLRAGDTGGETQHPVTTAQPPAEKVEAQVTLSRWPNTLRGSSPAADRASDPTPSQNRLPSVVPSKG